MGQHRPPVPSLNLLSRTLFRLILGWACVVAQASWAHDSWIRAMPGGASLEIGTGNRFPVMDVGVGPDNVKQSHCTDGESVVTLQAGMAGPRSLPLVPTGGLQPLACWVELGALDVVIDPALVQVYFNDIQAPAATRQAWADQQARGLRWQETYRKFARIELAAAAEAQTTLRLQARKPAGLPLEIVVLGEQALAARAPLQFQVLRDGTPLADFPVEFVSARSPVGIWRRTDGQGRLRESLPFPGRWLLRGTDLRPAPGEVDRWASRFVTLAIELR
ncbi:DUF4198 domain-containing protein [Ramlibacter pinisoli]|uniref:DUF4198 domain-containing protein n=1 Tax=Ramlibacter pinisoli TaxID=2682844 RepID=UPI0018E04DF5